MDRQTKHWALGIKTFTTCGSGHHQWGADDLFSGTIFLKRRRPDARASIKVKPKLPSTHGPMMPLTLHFCLNAPLDVKSKTKSKKNA